MTKLYRLYVGLSVDGSPRHTASDVITFAKAYQRSFTAIEAKGVYDSQTENSVILEFLDIDDQVSSNAIQELARKIAQFFSQTSVLYSVQTLDYQTFIYNPTYTNLGVRHS